MFNKVTIIVFAAFTVLALTSALTQAQATTCSLPNNPTYGPNIGFQYVAQACAQSDGRFIYNYYDLNCNQSGYVEGINESVGKTPRTPEEMQTAIINYFNSAYPDGSPNAYFKTSLKMFRNSTGSSFVLVIGSYSKYNQSIDGRNMGSGSYAYWPMFNKVDFNIFSYPNGQTPPCCLRINSISSDKTSINPLSGEKVTFTGSITANYPVTWNLSIVDRLFTGSGTTATATWDGKNVAGTIVVGGNYFANFTAQTTEVACTDSTSAIVTIINDACVDNDGDGYFGMSSTCPTGDDCNDNDPAIHPGATELCDGKDNNCNGQVDEPKFRDADKDGSPIQIEGCPVPGIYDCNDSDATIYFNAPEICGDQKDNNCNGKTDESCKRERCMEVGM